jgi:hypothetical protein
VDESTMNSLISLQNFVSIFTGSVVDSKTGTGVTEFTTAGFNHVIKFTMTGKTELARLELDVKKNGEGVDLIIDIKSGINVDGSSEGILLKTMCLPKEFIKTTSGYISIPIDLTGLTAGGKYWICVRSGGDATNNLRLMGEATQDANYPAYKRAGTSGAWTIENSIHFKIYSGDTGNLIHGLYDEGYTTIEYTGEIISKVYRYLPPIEGYAGGIRDILTYTWSGEVIKRGVVS